MGESFFDEMKRYLGFGAEDAQLLASLVPLIEPHLPALANRFYEEIPAHPDAAAVFTGGEAQIARLKLTLESWARRLFAGPHDDAYARERFQIGHRHVQIGLPQRFVIAAMHVVADFLDELLNREIGDPKLRRRCRQSVNRVLTLDLALICETYFEGSLARLTALNDSLAVANRRLHAADQAKSEFLAATSHELRTPLAAIVGFSQLLVDGYVATPDQCRDAYDEIHRNALHLLGLVDDMLDLARIENGQVEIGFEAVDGGTIVGEVAALLACEAQSKGLQLIIRAPPVRVPVRADSRRLRQVLLNVIGNGIKFTDAGSVSVVVEEAAEAGQVAIRVRDTGVGIAPAQHRFLFEKFRKLEISSVRRRPGLGLGLALSKGLIEQMGGAIAVESAGEGQGTTVTLSIPRGEPI